MKTNPDLDKEGLFSERLLRQGNTWNLGAANISKPNRKGFSLLEGGGRGVSNAQQKLKGRLGLPVASQLPDMSAGGQAEFTGL